MWNSLPAAVVSSRCFAVFKGNDFFTLLINTFLLYRVSQKSDTSRTMQYMYDRYHVFGPPCISV